MSFGPDFSPDEARDITLETIRNIQQHHNPGLAALLKFMGFEAVEWEAQGSTVTDLDGNDYLDCLGGFGAYALGHRPRQVVNAVRQQLDRLPMSSKILFNKPLADLCALLARVTPGDLQYAFICNSGAEAVEGALKAARVHTGRPGFVAALDSFHGKTLGALSASGRDVYRKPFEPLLQGFTHVPFGDVQALRKAVNAGTAAVLLEPIQGEAGVIIPPDDYLPAAREICDEHKALLILDEVQTGLGRTGALFACEPCGVAPDIMCLAKALGGGVMPIGAFIATPAVWKAFEPNPLLHSSTFGGSPLACAAAIAAIQAITEQDLPGRAKALGEYALKRLEALASAHPKAISQVRGRGLIIGVEFTHEDIAGLVIAGLAQRRIIAAYTLNNPRVIRFEPPLIIEQGELDKAMDALDEATTHAMSLLQG